LAVVSVLVVSVLVVAEAVVSAAVVVAPLSVSAPALALAAVRDHQKCTDIHLLNCTSLHQM
jgi:hypothetical protein